MIACNPIRGGSLVSGWKLMKSNGIKLTKVSMRVDLWEPAGWRGAVDL